MQYETRDSESAAILSSQGQRFTSRNDDGTVWFTFENAGDCEAILEAHINRELQTFSLDLTNAMHEVKKIIIRNRTAQYIHN